MKWKNSMVLNETKRQLSSNLVKIIIIINLILSSVSALRAVSFAGIEVYYFEEVLYHYLWLGLQVLMFSCLFMSMKIMIDLQTNYSFISRFSSKKDFIKKAFLINVLTISILIITCYLVNFLAFNLLSDCSLKVKVLENYNTLNIPYVSNLVYLIFFLTRSFILTILISLFNTVLIYILSKTKVFVINIVLIHFLFGFASNFSYKNLIQKVNLGFLDLRNYFRYPTYKSFDIELINSILIIVVLSILLYFSINVVKRVKNIEQ